MATVATGMPGGICTVESSESSPPSVAADSGTPITGSVVCAATAPARCAAPPGAADEDLDARCPRRRARSRRLLGRAVRRQHAQLRLDAELAERLLRRLHRREVAVRPHQDADLSHAHALLLMSDVAAKVHPVEVNMLRRRRRRAPRASSRSAPTRGDAEDAAAGGDERPPSRRVPAWNTVTPSTRAAASSPSIGIAAARSAPG